MSAVMDTPEVVEYEEHDLYEAAAPGTRSPFRILAHCGGVCAATESAQAAEYVILIARVAAPD